MHRMSAPAFSSPVHQLALCAAGAGMRTFECGGRGGSQPARTRVSGVENRDPAETVNRGRRWHVAAPRSMPGRPDGRSLTLGKDREMPHTGLDPDILTNFFQSSTSGCFTLAVEKASAIWTSGLPLLLTNNALATKLSLSLLHPVSPHFHLFSINDLLLVFLPHLTCVLTLQTLPLSS